MSAPDAEASRRLQVLVTPRLVAERLWLHGEDALARRALELTPGDVELLSFACGRQYLAREAQLRTWPGAPHEAYLVLAAIEYLSGERRPPLLPERRPADGLPTELRARPEWRTPPA